MARTEVFTRLPEIWQRLDQVENVVDQKGVLERYLSVWDDALDTTNSNITELLNNRDVDTIPDKYLGLLGDVVGHEWDAEKSYDWNRNKIRHAIPRASYKGTFNRLSDDMIELGAESVSVQDNASKLLILSKQGRLSEPDSYMVTADFWHDGAYVLRVVDSVVPSLLRSEVEPTMRKTVPAGTIWYLQYGRQLLSIWEMGVSLLHGQALRTGNQRTGALGFGQLITDYMDDDNEFLSWFPNRQVQKSYYPIAWHYKGNILDGTLSNALLGEDAFLSFCPTISLVKSHYGISYHESGSLFGLLGDGTLGYDLTLSYPIDVPVAKTSFLQKLAIFECGPTVATEDSYNQLLWVFEATTSKSRTGYIQQIDNGDAEDSRPQMTRYTDVFAVAQGYLTGDSNLPGNIDSIDGNQGTPDIPLTEYQAAIQTGVQKTYEEI